MSGGSELIAKIQEVGNAAFAAVVSEDSPVAPAIVRRHPAEISRRCRDRLFGDQAVVTQDHGVGNPVLHRLVNGLGAFAPDEGPLRGHAVTRGTDDAEAGRSRGSFRELHDAFGAGGTLGQRVAKAFEIGDGGESRCREAALQGRLFEELLHVRRRNAASTGERMRIAKNGEGLRLDHARGSRSQSDGVEFRPARRRWPRDGVSA